MKKGRGTGIHKDKMTSAAPSCGRLATRWRSNPSYGNLRFCILHSHYAIPQAGIAPPQTAAGTVQTGLSPHFPSARAHGRRSELAVPAQTRAAGRNPRLWKERGETGACPSYSEPRRGEEGWRVWGVPNGGCCIPSLISDQNKYRYAAGE